MARMASLPIPNPSGGAPPMPTTSPAPTPGSDPYLIPKTVANWIPVAVPPKIEKIYLVWVRQGGSIMAGIIDTVLYIPGIGWESDPPLGEGEQIDMWADVLSPFWYEAPGPGSPPISPTPPQS
jgi:hypothetical protein